VGWYCLDATMASPSLVMKLSFGDGIVHHHI
jgi:hypothetical protein